jgi:hypothetical protein
MNAVAVANIFQMRHHTYSRNEHSVPVTWILTEICASDLSDFSSTARVI